MGRRGQQSHKCSDGEDLAAEARSLGLLFSHQASMSSRLDLPLDELVSANRSQHRGRGRGGRGGAPRGRGFGGGRPIRGRGRGGRGGFGAKVDAPGTIPH